MTITNNLLYTNAQNTFANPRLEGALVSLIVCGLVAWFTWKRIAADYHPPQSAL
jgi:hypothetical protein